MARTVTGLSLVLVLSSIISITHAGTITLTGSVRHRTTMAPLDSATIEIINNAQPGERFTVTSSAVGLWSYTLQTTTVATNGEVPGTFTLAQNYPNPFNPSTTIPFSTPAQGNVSIAVYNAIGQLMDERSYNLDAGDHAVRWNASGAAGMLFYCVTFGETRLTRRMVQLDGHGAGGLGDVATSGRRSVSASMAKTGALSLTVITSKFLYMPDTLRLTTDADANIETALETVHERAIIFDLHNDVMEKAVLGYQIGIRHTTDQSDLPRFRDGGMDVQMFALWTNYKDSVAHPYYAYTLAMADTFKSQVSRSSDLIVQARSSTEIRAAVAAGKLAGILAIEGGHAIQNDLGKLRTYYDLGARYLTITWNNSTSWAVSAQDTQSATVGLNAFGQQVIRTMDSLGMLIDVAHTGIKTIKDILAITKNPIIDTHAGARALYNHYRNLTNEQLDSIGARGGVVGVVFYPSFLSATGRATIDSVVRHIDYIRNRIGVDHVAIGSDFDGIETVPVGLENVAKLPNLTAALLRKGYSIADVHKILGGNALRVFTQVCK
jgi:membrane dipeptidase